MPLRPRHHLVLLCLSGVLVASTGCPELGRLREENAALRREKAATEQHAAYAERVSATTQRERTEIETSYEEELRRRGEESAQLLSEAAARESELSKQVEDLEAKLAAAATAAGLAAEAAAKQRAELEVALKGAEAERDAARQEVARLTAEGQKAAERVKVLDGELAQAKKEVAARTAEATKSTANEGALAKLETDLASLRGGAAGIEVGRSPDGAAVVITIPGAALFDSGVIEVNASGAALLATVGKALQKASFSRLSVGGHADNQPIETLPFYNNTELSFRRAFAVAILLAEEDGVAKTKINVAAFGEHHPRASNATAEGRARNRRVELVVYP